MKDLSSMTSSEAIAYWERRCPEFTDGFKDHCDGDAPDPNQRYCNACVTSAERVRVAAEDNKERREEEGSWSQEARIEYLRVLNLCDQVLEPKVELDQLEQAERIKNAKRKVA